jgi:hypothetical protein
LLVPFLSKLKEEDNSSGSQLQTECHLDSVAVGGK